MSAMRRRGHLRRVLCPNLRLCRHAGRVCLVRQTVFCRRIFVAQRIADFAAQARGFALVVVGDAVDGVAIGLDGDKAVHMHANFKSLYHCNPYASYHCP